MSKNELNCGTPRGCLRIAWWHETSHPLMSPIGSGIGHQNRGSPWSMSVLVYKLAAQDSTASPCWATPARAGVSLGWALLPAHYAGPWGGFSAWNFGLREGF